jgi:acetoin:2,6-dichlorophenolindophenol oxidoreductase subunit alpha
MTPPKSVLTEMYEDMVTARQYEERLQEEYMEGKKPGFDISAGQIQGELHLAAGQEAAAVGVCHHLRDDDTVTAPHRPHHVAIAKGVDLKRMTAEIFGRETGLCRGKGGHMHLFDPDVNFACSGIIAQGCPPAVGAAMAAKKRNDDSIAVAYLGEGAISQGAFLESLNLASVHDLPVVFVIEDNDWAISMPKERIASDPHDGSRRADGFAMPGVRVDYDDAIAIYETAEEAVGRARDLNGPTVLEVQVHRRMGHFMGDPESYRPETDQESHQARDSIERLAEDLRDRGVDDELEEIRERAHERVEEAIDWAKEQPQPEPEVAYEDVFSNPPSGVTDGDPEPAATGGDD